MSGSYETAGFGTDAPDVSVHQTTPLEESRSLGQLLGEVTSDLSKLMHQELELAKAEVKEEVAKAGKSAGMLAGAGVAGHLVLILASFTLVFALAHLMGLAWAGLVVTIIWAVVAAVLAMRGKKALATVNPKPERTIETLKEDAQWVKTRSS